MQNEVDKGTVNHGDKLIGVQFVSDVDIDLFAVRRDANVTLEIFFFVVAVVSMGPGD